MDDDIDEDVVEGIGNIPGENNIPGEGPVYGPYALLALGLGSRRVAHSMVPQPLNVSLLCYPVAMMPGNERHDVESGGKIILPPSILQHLTRMNITYPMLFRLTNKAATDRVTHCGVLEFIADFNRCYIPNWMMRNLGLEPGDPIQVQSATLPVARFSKFEPQSVDFLDITNPKAMLENALRNFACLTEGEIISVMYNGKSYELRILETQPGRAVSIIECDMDVDFAPPVGYVEPERTSSQSRVEDETPHGVSDNTFVAFAGAGNRLDGKEVVQDSDNGRLHRRGIPDYNYVPGNLQFTRNLQYFTDKKKAKDEQKDASFTPFSGAGRILRPRLDSEDSN